MRITFVIFGLGPGGAERAVTGLANHWAHKHNISIITLVKTVPFYSLNENIHLSHCMEKSQSETNHIQSLKNGFSRIHRLIQLLRINKPDVVISFMHTSNIYAIWASKFLKIPCIISERANHAVNRLPISHEYLRNFSYPYCSSLVVQTVGNQKYYNNIVSENKINIIPNAIASELKSKRQLPRINKEKIILNVGSFKNGKAQDELIKSFSKIKDNNWRLIFLGTGPNLTKFKNLAYQLGFSDYIDFKGAQKNVSEYYNKSAIFIFTSKHEGFPNALLEALYFGVPCISTNCPHGPADLIIDGVNGYLIPVGNQEILLDKMKLLMKNEKLQESFSEQAIKHSKKFEIEYIAKKWEEVIKSVLPSIKI